MLSLRKAPAGGWLRFLGLALLLAGAGLGCGKDADDVKTVPVQGKVAFHPSGKPLTTGLVVFIPDTNKGNTSKHEARGTIDEQGNYKLICDAGGKEGAPVGWYKVTVFSTKPNPKDEYASIPLIPARYNDPKESGLSIEVVEKPSPDQYKLGILER